MKIKRNSRTAFREYDGTTLIITSDDRMVHKLNETGTFIWNHLGETEQSQDEIISMLQKEYEVSAEQALSEVGIFIDNALKTGIIEASGKKDD